MAALQKAKALRIRAGSGRHRFIGIWVVTVNGRAFVRSWAVEPAGWNRAIAKAGRGTIRIGERIIPVAAVRVRSRGLLDAIDDAYLEKYATPGSRKYAVDLGRPKSRATTLELTPHSGRTR